MVAFKFNLPPAAQLTSEMVLKLNEDVIDSELERRMNLHSIALAFTIILHVTSPVL